MSLAIDTAQRRARSRSEDVSASVERILHAVRTHLQQVVGGMTVAADGALPTVVADEHVDGRRVSVSCQCTASDVSEVRLSPREFEVARLVARGLPNKAIGAVLDISPWTVATHLRRIYVKLEVGTRAQLAVRLAGGTLVTSRTRSPSEASRDRSPSVRPTP